MRGVAEERDASSDGDSSNDVQVVQVYRDDFVRIVSDKDVSQAQARSLADRIEKAWQFDSRNQHWEDQKRLDRPLTVAVLSREAFGDLTGDFTGSTAGVTTGPDLFAVPETVLGRQQAQDENTIAHELGHVQDLREAGKQIDQIPIYLQEGKEYLLGEEYPLAEGMKNPHLQYVADALARLKGTDASWLLSHFRTVQDEGRPGNVGFFGEVTGALFVEFLRVHLGAGDAVDKLADVVEAVGHGEEFPTAFRKRFGMELSDAEKAFVQFIGKTEGNPAERLAGTLFDPAAKPAPARVA
jgi:hypothetical protein